MCLFSFWCQPSSFSQNQFKRQQMSSPGASRRFTSYKCTTSHPASNISIYELPGPGASVVSVPKSLSYWRGMPLASLWLLAPPQGCDWGSETTPSAKRIPLYYDTDLGSSDSTIASFKLSRVSKVLFSSLEKKKEEKKKIKYSVLGSAGSFGLKINNP